MECYCHSHKLYENQGNEEISVQQKKLSAVRVTAKHNFNNQNIAENLLQTSSIYLPTHIPKIDYHQITDNPLWFYRQFIASNKPCIIENTFSGTEIIQNWKNPKHLIDEFNSLNIKEFSTSITPDGFADSIKNQYFIEPEQIKTGVKSIIGWGQNQQSQIKQEWVPYVQHQNSNLTEELKPLYQKIEHESRDFFSSAFFNSCLPDAQNFWMGYKNSVSAIHKDPYQNFYPVIVGEKHFTLMPPISILYMPQNEYKNSKWTLIDNELKIKVNEKSLLTNWISCNPDLERDWERFAYLSKIKQYHFHVNVEAGSMLYLPSLWYHQVSQFPQKGQSHIIAMNYWFDMSFGHNFSLYETARKIRNYN